MNYQFFLTAFREKYKTVSNQDHLMGFLREELQYLILEAMYGKITFPLYFMGGTQLRLSYGISRFSEDLDFVLDKPTPSFPSESFVKILESSLRENVTGFRCRVTFSSKRNVFKVMLHFSNILFDLDLSPLQDQTLKIKIEIDTNPPAHASYDQKEYHSFMTSYFLHTFDLSTGFSGKLGAILEREYQKGRDYFDLQWYLRQSPKIQVNLAYYNANAKLMKRPAFKTTRELFSHVEMKVKSMNLDTLKKDLSRFVLMSPKDFEIWLQAYQPSTLELLSAYKKNV